MGKSSGFTCFALTLLIGISGSVSAVARERTFAIPGENEPIESICFPRDNERQDAVCVTFYGDEDGYEVCVADVMRESCISNYSSADPDDGPEENRWSVSDL